MIIIEKDIKSKSLYHFYAHYRMFALGAEYLPKTMTVFKMTDGGKNVEFAALLILMKLENYLLAF